MADYEARVVGRNRRVRRSRKGVTCTKGQVVFSQQETQRKGVRKARFPYATDCSAFLDRSDRVTQALASGGCRSRVWS
jgi:hypothetical protein